MEFISRFTPPVAHGNPAFWFIFQGDKLLVRLHDGTAAILRAVDPSEFGIITIRRQYLGDLIEDGGPSAACYGAEIAADAPLPSGLIAEGLRQLYPQVDETLMTVAGRAIQIVAWDRTHRFCGQCGAPTEDMARERAKHCPQCGQVSYPRLSPAIIIAIVRAADDGKRLLLARNHRFPAGRYSVLAGYVEPGETLEECARREVLEEVGIRIENIRYFGSQPWPFPNSLMIGFTAEYGGGNLTLDRAELAEAAWFAPDALPGLPPKYTIARQLIDWFVASSQDHPPITRAG